MFSKLKKINKSYHFFKFNYSQSARIKLWEDLYKSNQSNIENAESVDIKIQLMDEKILDLKTPLNGSKVASTISNSLAKNALAVKINGKLSDLSREITEDSKVEIVIYNEENLETKKLFWHSSSHLLGCALEKYYQDKIFLCDGPAVDEGFFYEFFSEDPNFVVSQDHFEAIEKMIDSQIKGSHPFQRMVVNKEIATKMFDDNQVKKNIIKEIKEDVPITLYRCGDFIDLCRGPHLPNTNKIKAFKLLNISASRDPLSNQLFYRIYGISFPSDKALKEWQKMKEEAAKRDHREIGKKQNLIMFHKLSPGNPFFLPDGAFIYNKLVELMRREYLKRGYREVITPLIFNKQLWETSGHWENYKEDMFTIKEGASDPNQQPTLEHTHCDHSHHNHGENIMGLKPMNCPGHCLIFSNETRSYKDLPIRLADFGVLHRNERAGALTGLTRVRKFQQDDAHIFCREDQIEQEVFGCIDFIEKVYSIFGFKFSLKLSTRPEKYLGDIELWNKAEDCLKKVLNDFCKADPQSQREWKLNEGDGAFYGPKIDIELTDAIGRKHQCATVQLDFQLPRRFSLEFINESGHSETPVMIHRAILGSLERFFAVLIEHTAGKWPFWLNPKQISLVPVHQQHHLDYLTKIENKLKSLNFRVESDLSDNTLSKKIRNSQLSGFNYIIVLGSNEEKNGTVNVRERDTGDKTVEYSLEEFLDLIQSKNNPN